MSSLLRDRITRRSLMNKSSVYKLLRICICIYIYMLYAMSLRFENAESIIAGN